MTKIKQRLLKVQAAVVVEKANGGGALGEQIGLAAERAMIEGMSSDAWKAYMSLFADSADQLKRLTTTELDGVGADAQYLPRLRAYIVANAICAPGTDAATIKGVLGFPSDIDNDRPDGEPLSEMVDETVVALRPVNIP